MLRRSLTVLCALLILSLLAAPLHAATFIVTVNTDSPGLGPTGSLRRAVNSANTTPGADSIVFAAGITSITLSAGRLTVSETLTVDGGTGAASNLVISGGWNNVDNNTVGSRIFYTSNTFTGTLTINNLTLTNGNAGSGGNMGPGFCLDAPPATSPNGGALCIGNGTVILNRVRITNSTANDGGAIQIINGNLQINDSTLDNNKARDDAGVIQMDGGSVTITNSTFTSNSAGFGSSGAPPGTGGIARIVGGSMSMNHVTVAYNSADQFGALQAQAGTTLTLNNSLFVGNNATQAGQEDGCAGGGTINLGNSWANNDPAASTTPGNTSCANFSDSAANIALSTTLAANAGLTDTLALAQSSTVRGVLAVPCALPADQRAVSRGQGGEDCEPGAYELNPAITTLSVSKDNGVTELVLGASTTYTITVSNNGPASVDNALLTDPAPANLSFTSITCSSTSGGATCPPLAQVTLANLSGPGIAIPTLPVGASISFTLIASVIP